MALVLRALGLGDLLAGVPALRGIRAALPGHRIVLATAGSMQPLVELIGGIDAVHPTSGLQPLRWAGPAPAVAMNLHGRGPQSHALLRETGAHNVLGFNYPGAPGWVNCPGAPGWADDEHEVRRWCRLVDATLGGPCDPDELDLAVPPVRSAWPDAVVVHPGAAFESRRWPPERFAAVARTLAEQGHHVVVTGSAAERPLGIAVTDDAGLGPEHLLAGRTSVLELAALVATARLVISGDTGVGHLATAYRRPSVLLFGPSPPALWGPPPRAQHVVLWRGTGSGDPFASTIDPALTTIGVEDVLAASERLLSARGE